MTLLPDSLLVNLLAFRSARDWEQFHSPQNLAIAISVEAGELLEHFQWMREGESRPEPAAREALELEVADLVILLSYLCHDLAIDPADAVTRKLAINEARYAADKSKGRAMKYDKLSRGD